MLRRLRTTRWLVLHAGLYVVLNAAFGLSPNQPGLLWWLFSAVALGFSLGLLYGLFVAPREQPLP